MAIEAKKVMDKPCKHPSAKLDYDADYTNWLPEGVTISSATCTVGAGLTSVGSATINGTRVKQVVSGGTDGVDYELTYAATGSNGLIYVMVLVIPVRA